MKMRKIPAAMPPATSMNTPGKEGHMNRNRADTGICEFPVYISAAPTKHERMV